MDFLSNLADSTPVLGHGKALYHYAVGEEEKGDEALYQSTRTTAVIGGGIVGGPAGAVGAGLATDAAASALMKKEKGFINSCKNIDEDIKAGRNPTNSIAHAGLQVGLDAFSGYGGSSSGAGNVSRRAAGKTMQMGGKEVIQKSVRISAEEAGKMVTRKSSQRAAQIAAQRAFQATAHVGLSAAQRTELEERERRKRKRRERECREREQREREWRERERRERERRESERRERESREQEERVREWREREQREREWRERERREREWREREQREREWREQEQREREQQRKGKQQKSKNQEESKKREQRANSEKQKRDTSGSSSGSSQPPQGNKDNNKKRAEKNEPSFFENFMKLLRRILKIVYGTESEPFSNIFENLLKEDRKYLATVIKPIMASGTLEVVIELVIRMFKQHLHRDISFLTFLSQLEFVQTYITDELLERTLISSGTETAETKMKPEERRGKLISEIASEKDIVEKLIELFKKLKIEVEAETAKWDTRVFPKFRDIFAEVSHYFKHKKLPDNGRILSVKEYFDWVLKFLGELKHTHKLTELKKSKDPKYVHEIFVPIFRRRYRIVLKVHGDKITLSSAFVVNMMHPDDKEKHAIVIVAEIFAMIFMAISLLFILKNVFFYAPMLLLNTVLMVCSSIAFIVKLLLNTLLFFFACFIFILKVVLNILLIFAFLWLVFFYFPDQR